MSVTKRRDAENDALWREKMKDKWRTKDGRELVVEGMSTEHIISSLALLKRKGFVSPSTVEFYLTCPSPVGDMAQVAFDQECSRVFSSPVSLFIDVFKAELKKRGGESCVS